MTYEYILRAACRSLTQGKRAPHCYSAHVPGQGYVNKGDPPHDRADLRQLVRDVESEIDNIEYASGYAEPGYTDPEHGVLFANWNKFPRGLDAILERAGYGVEWSDEWSLCDDCGKAVRMSADSYGRQAAYIWADECTILCLACVDWADYLRSIEDDPDKSVRSSVDPSAYGYVRLSDAGEFENGLHPGQTDKPTEILKRLHDDGRRRIVFRIADVGQFDVRFETWQHVDHDGEEG